MNSPDPVPFSEGRDTVICEFSDTDLKTDLPQDRFNEVSVRHRISTLFSSELRADRSQADLDRLLAVAREKEQFCRGAHDVFGLNRCLGNQALIQKARGKFEESLALLRQLETLSRRVDDGEGLAFALLHQAALLDKSLNRTAEALPLAEQGQRLAETGQLTGLASLGDQILRHIHSRLQS